MPSLGTARRGLFALLVFLTTQMALAQSPMQDQIDDAFRDIMQTKTGKAICKNILGGEVEPLAFHLGVSLNAARDLASQCTGTIESPWVYATSPQDIQKLTLMPIKARHYSFDTNPAAIDIESWTDPFSNSTIFFGDPKDLSHSHLVQLLAHELAVYFDSKSNPAHVDAQKIPELRDMNLISADGMSPLVAISDPLIAHTMTFVRALQVEYSIVDELVAAGKIAKPDDYNDVYLRFLISPECKEECLEKLISRMHDEYLPISLPLIAFAPHFRSLLANELPRLNPQWSTDQWSLYQSTMNEFPASFLQDQFNDQANLVLQVQKIFKSENLATPKYQQVSAFLQTTLWPLERAALSQAKLPSGQTLLEFMKQPLMSGYNIKLSSGPRVRIRIGITE